MKKLWKFIYEFFKLFRKALGKAEQPIERSMCMHCGLPYTIHTNHESPETEVEEIYHAGGVVDTVTRHHPTGKVEIARRSLSGKTAKYYLDLCEICLLMKPKFLDIFIGKNGAVQFFWESSDGERYERYQFGEGPVREKSGGEEEINSE